MGSDIGNVYKIAPKDIIYCNFSKIWSLIIYRVHVSPDLRCNPGKRCLCLSISENLSKKRKRKVGRDSCDWAADSSHFDCCKKEIQNPLLCGGDAAWRCRLTAKPEFTVNC